VTPHSLRAGRLSLRLPRSRPVLIALDAVMAANAFAGAWYAVAGAPGVPTEWLDGTPFDDYLVPGLILGGVVGASQVVAAIALWRRAPRAKLVSQLTSTILIVWIVTQLAMIGYVSALQPIVLAWALITLRLAARLEA